MGKHLKRRSSTKVLRKKPRPADPAEAEKKEEFLKSITLKTAKTHKGRLAIAKREPQVHEPPKVALFLRSATAKPLCRQLLKDLSLLQKPFVISLARKQSLLDPFQDHEPVEYLCKKNLCGKFAFALSSKSKPFRMCFGRVFEDELLDMYECSISDYKPLSDFAKKEQPIYGAMPLIIAQGSEFDTSDDLRNFRNCMIDFFSVGKPSKVLLSGLRSLVTLTAVAEPVDPSAPAASFPDSNVRIIFRRYLATVPSSWRPGTVLESTDLAEVGPRFTMQLARRRSPDLQRWKAAIKLPKEIKKAKVKNISTTVLGETVGRIHVGVQDLGRIHTPHHHKNTSRVTAETSAAFNEPNSSGPDDAATGTGTAS